MTTTATLALGEVLSTTTGAYLMKRYSEASECAQIWRESVDKLSGRRASNDKVEAGSGYGYWNGKSKAYRDALAVLVVVAGDGAVSRWSALRAVTFEAEQINNPVE